MKLERLAVTGLGIVNGLGHDIESSWQRLLNNESAIKDFEWPDIEDHVFREYRANCPVKVGAGLTVPECPRPEWEKEWRNLDQSIRCAVHASDQALKSSGLTTKNIAVIFGSIGSQHTRTEGVDRMVKGKTKFPPRKTLNFEPGHLGAIISRLFGLRGSSYIIYSACSTGLHAIDSAQRLLTTDPTLDAVLIGSGDCPLEENSAFYFSNLGALSTRTAKDACRPFDQDRSGFILGEAGTAMVLQRAKDVTTTPFGYVNSVGAVTIPEHETSPDAEGEAATLAATRALELAELEAKDIGYINAHATGTQVGDIIEYNAMLKLFPNTIMTANKGHLGHSIAGAGFAESIYTILALRDQETPPVAKLENPCGKGMILPREKMPIDTQYAIKNNYAFGGRSLSAIFESPWDKQLQNQK